MEKICSKCKVSKTLDCFNRNSHSKDGMRCSCKCCDKITTEKYTAANKDKINERKAEYRSRPEIKEIEKQKYKEYYNRDEIKARYKDYRNQPEVKDRYNEYFNRPDVKEHKKEIGKVYAPIRKKRLNEKYHTDEKYQLTTILRSRLHKALSRNKNDTTINYIGCDVVFLKKWLEFRFDENMNWTNLGSYWHIDHILPINRFDFTNERHKYICFHWTNLQPLTCFDNQSKSDSLHLHHYFNNIVNINRFNTKHTQFLGYQTLSESLEWLRVELRYGKNPSYEDAK